MTAHLPACRWQTMVTPAACGPHAAQLVVMDRGRVHKRRHAEASGREGKPSTVHRLPPGHPCLKCKILSLLGLRIVKMCQPFCGGMRVIPGRDYRQWGVSAVTKADQSSETVSPSHAPCEEESLEQLAQRAKEGDEAALEELLRRIQPDVLRRCARFLPYRQDAEEACQDALMRVAANIHNFRGDSMFTTWLYTVVSNSARQTYRALKRRAAEMPYRGGPPAAPH